MTDYLSEEYDYIDTIENDLICSICLNAFIQPVIHNECENMFCKKCVKNLDKCPLCRKQILAGNITYTIARFITNKLNDLEVYCPIDNRHIIKRRDLKKHIEDEHNKLKSDNNYLKYFPI